jgi:diadenylate cyclase
MAQKLGAGVPTSERDAALRNVLASVAPGTWLRDGLERILRGSTGALIVVGFDERVESLCTGGFPLDVESSATRLRELAKMDGAVVLSSDGAHILRAATHLMPDPAIETDESGTRHRTAQRVAVQTGHPVISVSQSMRIIALYLSRHRYVLESSGELLGRANQAIATLERYKARLDEVSNTLSALEIEDLVTVRDAAMVLQRLEMVRRIADEITGYVVELGTHGRLLALQLEELMAGVDADRDLIARDYVPSARRGRTSEQVLAELADLSATDLLDLGLVASAMGFTNAPESLDGVASPRGYRLLARVPRLPGPILDRVVQHFDGLQKLLAATVEDLQSVEGVGESRARGVREAISRLADASIIDRYP